MAIIWQKQSAQNLYQVRSAGRTTRLYKNNVLHSEFNPDRILTRGVWDLFLGGSLFRPHQSLHRILVLGVGGGSALSQLNYCYRLDKIIGIELDPIHVYIGKKFFDLDQPNIELKNQAASDFLNRYRGKKFDIIIDDLFDGKQGNPERSQNTNAIWINQLKKQLNPQGVLMFNFDDSLALKQSTIIAQIRHDRHLNHAKILESERHANQVVITSSSPLLKRRMNTQRQRLGEINSKLKQLDFKVKSVAIQ